MNLVHDTVVEETISSNTDYTMQSCKVGLMHVIINEYGGCTRAEATWRIRRRLAL